MSEDRRSLVVYGAPDKRSVFFDRWHALRKVDVEFGAAAEPTVDRLQPLRWRCLVVNVVAAASTNSNLTTTALRLQRRSA